MLPHIRCYITLSMYSKRTCLVIHSTTKWCGFKMQVMWFPHTQWCSRHLFTTHHSDSIVEQRLAKDQDIQLLIDVNVLKDSKHGHGVHSWDQAAKKQVLEQRDVTEAKCLNLADAKQRHPNANGIPQCAYHSIPENGAKVLKEGASGHEVASIQNDGWEEIQEKHICLHGWGRLFVNTKDNPT